MKRTRIATALLGLLMLLPGASFSWTREGHETAAMVGQELLTPRARQAIDDLRKDPRVRIDDLLTKTRNRFYQFVDPDLRRFLDPSGRPDLRLVSSWADGWKTYHPKTGEWHFINIPARLKTLSPGEVRRYCRGRGCVTAQIEDQARILGDRSAQPRDRLKALFFLVHFTADLHQPLHVATDRTITVPRSKVPATHDGDNGGNLKAVTFFGETQNLHLIWDLSIIERTGKKSRRLADDLLRRLKPIEKKQWQAGTPEDWAVESWQVAVDKVYKEYPKDGSIPDYGQAYEDEMAPVVQDRLTRAGVRLAWMLNRIFEKVE